MLPSFFMSFNDRTDAKTTYDDRGFITGEDAIESLYGYVWDDKHDGNRKMKWNKAVIDFFYVKGYTDNIV